MISTTKIEMDVSRNIGKFVPSIDVVQDDRYSRNIEITVLSNGTAVSLIEKRALIRYVKADGTGGNYDALPDGTPAFTISGNVLTVALAPQVCTFPGIVKMVVAIIDGETYLHTFPLDIKVHRNPGLQIVSENYLKMLGAVPDSGWPANMYLGTDEKGNVIAKESSAGGGGSDCVSYSPQTLTPDQQEQARKNIDALKVPRGIARELFFFGEHDDFQTYGNQRIYKIAGQQVWLNSPADFDFRVRFNITRNLGQVEEYAFTKSDCTIIETVQGRKHWQFFANVSGTPSLVLTVANGIDPVSFESEAYCSFIYPAVLENYSVEFFQVFVGQELKVVTSVNGAQADDNGNVVIETGGGSEVYVLADGETIEDAPESAEIIIDPNEEAPTYVQTVNGNKPDENGNVNIEVGGGSGSTVEAKLPITLGSFQYYTWERIPGNTIEEKAKQIARFDVVVYQGELSSNLSMSGDAYQRDLALYTKALEYNPNLKVFGYITARGFANSVAGSFHVGMTEYRTSPANVDHPIWTKEELAAYINLMAHCGGTKDESAVDEFGNPVLTGGIPLYGVFFDDYDYNFEDDNTHLINQGDWNSIREKHNFLIDYVHSCGMRAMPNSSPMLIFDNEPTPNSIRNPDGIASHMSEDDWFCRESYFLRSDNTFGLNDNHLTEYNERYRDSYKSKCLALTYINAVSDDAEDNEQIASTFAIYQALCQGAAAIALHGATLVTEIPDEFAKYYDRDDTAVYTSGNGFYGLTVNGHNIVASRSINDTAYGQIPDSVALATCKVTIDGQHIFNNMYPKTEELVYGFASLENGVTREIEELKSKVEQSSNLYHRASIDDWEKDYAVSDYKNYSFTFENAFGGEDTNSNSSWNAENPYDFKIFLPKLGSWRRVTMDVRNLAGKTVELGFDKCDAYISGSPTTKIPNAMWQIHANCDSNSWLQLATFDVNTLSKSSIDGVERCCVKFTLPSDIKDLSFWTNRGVAEPSGIWVLEAKGTYLVDTSEHQKQKTWFTNYAPSMSSWGAMGNWSNYEILRNGDEVTTRYTAKSGCYESGVYLPENKDIFKPGETWELGFKDIRLVRDDNANASHKMVIMCNIGTNICPDIYITGKTYSDYKAMKSATGDDNLIAISRFTVPASHSGGMPRTPLYVWPQEYVGGDDIGLYSLIVEGLYLYKIDERDELFIRGEDLPDTYIAINRVRTDTVDEKLSPDTLYLVDDGSMFATNFRGERIGRGGSGGGAQSDWNAKEGEPGHVLNRTHFAEKVEVDPNFDNDLAGRVVVPMANTVNLVKITDYVLTEEECVGASVSVVMGGQSSTLPITTTGVIDLTAMFGIPCFMATPDMFLEYGLPFVAVIKESGTVQGLEVSAGTYYVSESSMALYVSHFSALDGIEYEIVQKLPAKYLPDSVANWNAANGEAGYVQNRTHWIEFTPEVVLPKKEYYNTAFEEYGWIFSGNVDGDEALDEMQLVEGETYVVTYKGTAYECVCKLYDRDGEQRPYLGNKYLLNGGEDTREPFAVETGCITIAETVSEYVSIGIEHMKESVRKLPEKFLPETAVLKKDIAQLSKVEWLPVREERTEPEVLFDINISDYTSGAYSLTTKHGIGDLPLEIGMTVKVLFDNVEYQCTVNASKNTSIVPWWLGDGSINSNTSGTTESTGEPFLLIRRKSGGDLLLYGMEAGNHTMSMIAEITQMVPVPMPEEFLPESVDGVVIRSSTEGSTKKFKLTVDDSGNITATELT